ncbi:MAG: GNAT superfamily N-acetyltransferase [Saprospiraceae bacterium]|jgi:GNAT superfamily N-acetyltransferase|tara:strand:+ start:141 stop:1268 length:1128 start_codon:yes stop_codon:yes gene_type:complete
MTTTISKVTNKKDKKDFINFPHDLYSGDKNYVPELYLNISEVLSEKKNPFFKHSRAELFLAKDNLGKTVGRIAAIQDNNYNEHHDSNIGFFGFFDVINDYTVAKQLLDTANDWVKANGAVQILGPTNFTTNDTAGVLVDGFDSPPTVMMTYNKPYYSELLERYGYAKEMDLFAYLIPTDEVNEKSLRLATMLQERLKRKGITIRTSTKGSKKSDIQKIKPVYLAAWEKNWGFVPPTDAEFDHLAEGLNLLLDLRYVYLAEHEGKLIGFGVALPDINEITKDFNKGKLLPFNIIKLLTRKSKVSLIRIILLGVLEDYRKLGIEAIFFANYIKAAKENNLRAGEASWILESNTMMVQAAEKLNGKRYKTYRIFSKSI